MDLIDLVMSIHWDRDQKLKGKAKAKRERSANTRHTFRNWLPGLLYLLRQTKTGIERLKIVLRSRCRVFRTDANESLCA